MNFPWGLDFEQNNETFKILTDVVLQWHVKWLFVDSILSHISSSAHFMAYSFLRCRCIAHPHTHWVSEVELHWRKIHFVLVTQDSSMKIGLKTKIICTFTSLLLALINYVQWVHLRTISPTNYKHASQRFEKKLCFHFYSLSLCFFRNN